MRTEIEKLEEMSLDKKAQQNLKPVNLVIVAIMLIFLTIGILYYANAPEYYEYEYSTYTFNGILKPFIVLIILAIIGILLSFIFLRTIGKKWKDYNNIIKEARTKLKTQELLAMQQKPQEKSHLINMSKIPEKKLYHFIPKKLSKTLRIILFIVAGYLICQTIWHYVQYTDCKKAAHEYAMKPKDIFGENNDLKELTMTLASQAHEQAMHEDLWKCLLCIIAGQGVYILRKRE